MVGKVNSVLGNQHTSPRGCLEVYTVHGNKIRGPGKTGDENRGVDRKKMNKEIFWSQ